MEYIEGMSVRYAGGDPDQLLQLARVLDEAAWELRRLQARVQPRLVTCRLAMESAVLLARSRAWAAVQAEDVERRARQLSFNDTILMGRLADYAKGGRQNIRPTGDQPEYEASPKGQKARGKRRSSGGDGRHTRQPKKKDTTMIINLEGILALDDDV